MNYYEIPPTSQQQRIPPKKDAILPKTNQDPGKATRNTIHPYMKNNLSKDALELAKHVSHKIWDKYDDHFGYRSEKQLRNSQVSTDIPDNIWFFWNQFDSNNQSEFLMRVDGAIMEGEDGAIELMDFLEKNVNRYPQKIDCA